MRSSKSRSRSKSNRNRSSGGGNVVNRVFDSSGPEGKVRGTPQQIIDKYNQLERDATLSNDRVAAENFQQHAEHYTRMLSEAQREQDARREEQERQNRDRQIERDRERAERVERQERESSARAEDPATAQQPDVLDLGAGEQPAANDSGLVETPESKIRKPSRRPRTRKPAVKNDGNVAPTSTAAPAPAQDEPPEAAE
ncbi:MAG: DUF4167 domain-containing protein [Rhodobacteraceae bacterium]|nr:DUF4167 domain-containing protein [Paracoccaceae bacterium]